VKLPIRGAKVGRGKWFGEIKVVILNHGFASGAPGRMASPGFYFFNRAGFVIQILPEHTISVTRPDGAQQKISSRRIVKVDSILDALVMEIEDAVSEQRETAGELK
jgi:hypothetical protein